MYAVIKPLSTLIIVCLVLFSAPIYAGAKHNDNDPASDVYFNPYYSPYYSPYFYPYVESNDNNKKTNIIKTRGFYPRHYVAPDTSAQDTSVVMKAQEKLCSLGYYDGDVDGQIGPQTKEAIGKFQHAKKLPVTHMLDSKTLKELHVEATNNHNKRK